MNKTALIVSILVFVFVTVFVLSLENSASTRHVKFTNQNFEIKHENTELVNDNKAKISLNQTDIENKDAAINSTDVKLNNLGNLNNQTSSLNDNSSFGNKQIQYNNSGNVSSQKIKYKNLDDRDLDDLIKNANKKVTSHPVDYNADPMDFRNQDRYTYRNIDWNTWRSNFVNRILDDSINIHELDRYGEGTWFVYSFEVHKNGAISNISVKSMYLTAEDKQLVANLIKSYQFKNITIFPNGSKRQVAKVTAVMMLSNTSSYSKPSDFNDGEKVKIKM